MATGSSPVNRQWKGRLFWERKEKQLYMKHIEKKKKLFKDGKNWKGALDKIFK